MSSKFYISIIEEEKSTFNTKEEALNKAAKDVAKAYSQKALQSGSTFVDYNNPPNRCAYLFKFAAVHTGLTAKYFQKLIKKKEILNIFYSKKHLKICSLGGGPGTDIVGIFKAMSVIPSLHKKIVQVTVLDICGGWRNSFKHVISRLKHGIVAGVPASFVDANDFQADLIQVDLLKPLPENIRKIISSSDIISMVKFVSAVVGNEGSINALKAIASIVKPGATIFFIDNFQGKVFEPLDNISKDCGLNTTLGPLHEVYISSLQKPLKPKPTAYGCPPLNCTRISVISWTKTNMMCSETITQANSTFISYAASNSNEEDDWNTDSDSEDSNRQLQTINDQIQFSTGLENKNSQIASRRQLQLGSDKIDQCRQAQIEIKKMLLSMQLNAKSSPDRFKKSNTRTNIKQSKTDLNKYTQTEADISEIQLEELQDLIDATSELIKVINELKLGDNSKLKYCNACSY